MNLLQARSIMDCLLEALSPGCIRIEPAGSYRRAKPDVGDLEIVAIPDPGHPRPVFGEKAFSTNLDAILYGLQWGDGDTLRLSKPIAGGPKYKKFWVSRNHGYSWLIKLDLFLVTPPAQWGVDFLIRTGPHDFSQWMVTHQSMGGALPDGFHCEGASIWSNDGRPILMPEEIDYLKFCGLDWIDPSNRRPQWGRFSRKDLQTTKAI
jgi:DNA polymerase/3'-5' exonuclease PolX